MKGEGEERGRKCRCHLSDCRPDDVSACFVVRDIWIDCVCGVVNFKINLTS